MSDEQQLGHITEHTSHLQQYVEKERTRTLLIEAARGGTVTDYWRQVLITVIFVFAVTGTFVARTKRFKDVMDKLSVEPSKSGSLLGAKKTAPAKVAKVSDPDKLLTDAEAAWQRQEKAGAAVAVPDVEDPAALENARASREALGARLEAVGSGQAMPPNAAAVTAALQGNAPAGLAAGTPPAARAPASPADSIAQAQALLAQPAAQAGAASYVTVKQIPAAYVREKQEFPDIR